MDKKNTFLGLIFIGAGIGFMFWQSQQYEKQRIEQLKQAETLQAPASQSTTPAEATLVAPDATISATDSKSSLSVSDLFQQVEAVEVEAATKPVSVSYTHLTLPTICSV